MDGRITPHRPYGEHIPLTCRHHPEKRWSTKNIEYIGARSLFYNLGHVLDMGPECACPASDLVVAPEVEAAAIDAEVDREDARIEAGQARWAETGSTR